MKRWRKIGRMLFILTILVTTLLLGLAAFNVFSTLQELDRLRLTLSKVVSDTRELDQIREQDLKIADQLDSAMGRLDGFLIECVLQRNMSRQAAFQEVASGLDDWIAELQRTAFQSKLVIEWPVSLTVEMRRLTDDVAVTYSNYVAGAQQAMDAATAASAKPDAPLIKLTAALGYSQKLSSLSARARAQAELIDSFRAGSKSWLPELQNLTSLWLPQLVWLLILAAVFAAISLAGPLALGTYRILLRPLRIKMEKTDYLIEHQKKFVHLGELAASLAHEIRNPMVAINARLFTLQRGLQPGSEEDNDARIIRGEIKRLDRIVRDFLALARPAEPNRTRFATDLVLREVQELMAPTLLKQDVELKLGAIEPTEIFADAEQLKQVLINLIQNAAESMTHGGHIVLRAYSGRSALSAGAVDAMLIEVEDDGEGIPLDVQQKLFDPFFSTKEEGTGLGLPIAKRILLQHGGSLEFESEQDCGTIFRIVLPKTSLSPT